MFDVDWSDPNRESVGDRRARKRKEKEKEGNNGEQYKKEEQRSGQVSGHGSVRSSISSVDKQFGFFGGRNKRKVLDSAKTRPTKAKSTKTQSTASSSLQSPTVTIQEQELSSLDENASLLSSPASLRDPPGPSSPPSSPGLPRKLFASKCAPCCPAIPTNTKSPSPPAQIITRVPLTNWQPSQSPCSRGGTRAHLAALFSVATWRALNQGQGQA